MIEPPFPAARGGLLALPRSSALLSINLALSLVVAAIGFGLGFAQGLAAQLVILGAVVSAAALFWLLNYVTVGFESRRPAPHPEATGGLRHVWAENRVLVTAMALLLLAFLILVATVPSFRTVLNILAFLLLEAAS